MRNRGRFPLGWLTLTPIGMTGKRTSRPAVDCADGSRVTLMKWHGSSDLQATRDANAMAVFPAEPREYQAGDPVDVILW